MASQAMADTSNAANKGPQPLVPPDEKFWQRYSPHHELPLSSVTSFTLHFLVIAFLALAVIFAPRLGLMSKENRVSVEGVQVGGLGGGETGVGAGPGSESRAEDIENVPEPNEKSKMSPGPIGQINVPPTSKNPVDLANLKSADGSQAIEAGKQAIQKLESVSKDAGSKKVVGLKSHGSDGASKGGN